MTFLPRSLMRGMEGGWKFRPSIADVLSFVHCGRNYVRSFVHRLPLPRYFFTCCGSLELSSTSFSPQSAISDSRIGIGRREREREREARAGETEGDGEEKGGTFKKGGIGPKSLFSVLFLSLSPVSKAVPSMPIPRRRDELFVPCYCIMRTYYSICISTDYGAVITFIISSSKKRWLRGEFSNIFSFWKACISCRFVWVY